jgi:UDP-N-acetylmuramate--alanine ligase
MQLANLHSLYFIGIGGIGMSALARYFHRRGARVAGYDRTETPLTRQLAAEGMKIHYTAAVDQLPESIDLVVYTPAVPADFPELVALRERGVPIRKRAEVLGIISRGMDCIAIAGTHGKTTTTTLTTHLLHSAGIDANAFLGGIARNFATNYVAGDSNWVVVEADEYDRSFLHLTPNVAVITSLDPDHLDIYGDHEKMLETGYLAFAQRLVPGGKLIVRWGLSLDHFTDQENLITFGIDLGDYRASNVRVEDGWFVFDLHTPGAGDTGSWRLPLPGRHNVLNALAAIAVCMEIGAEVAPLKTGLAAFKGIARRFDFVVRTPEAVLIDDYAHHPAELNAAITAARELYPDRQLTGIFQPHLYTRTRDFAAEFALALDKLDEPLLLPIYPAREAPIAGVSSQMLLDRMTNPRAKVLDKSSLLDYVRETRPDTVLVLGAGDIDQLVAPLAEIVGGGNANDK